MTEAEWLTCADPNPLLEYLRDKASDRKLRLFACACCRRIWHVLTDSRQAVELAERIADGQASQGELEEARQQAELIWTGFESDDDVALRTFRGYSTLWSADDDATDVAEHFAQTTAASVAMWEQERLEQSVILRDIFGNPFRPVTIDPFWRTPTVLSIAQTTYQERQFDRMPILADALEDAGCTSQDILNHCRQPGDHVRGCWVVDLVLGKE